MVTTFLHDPQYTHTCHVGILDHRGILDHIHLHGGILDHIRIHAQVEEFSDTDRVTSNAVSEATINFVTHAHHQCNDMALLGQDARLSARPASRVGLGRSFLPAFGPSSKTAPALLGPQCTYRPPDVRGVLPGCPAKSCFVTMRAPDK